MLTDDDLFILQETINEQNRKGETGSTSGFDLNLREISKHIKRHLDKLVATRTIDPPFTYTEQSLIEALKTITKTHEKVVLKAPSSVDLESSIVLLREYGVSDAALEILSRARDDDELMSDIKYAITETIIPMMNNAKRSGKDDDRLKKINPDVLKDALKEMTKRFKEQIK